MNVLSIINIFYKDPSSNILIYLTISRVKGNNDTYFKLSKNIFLIILFKNSNNAINMISYVIKIDRFIICAERNLKNSSNFYVIK